MQRDIMRSVPKNRLTPKHPGEPKSVLAGSHHAYILWPLYLVGSMSLAADRVTAWVVHRMKILSEEGGIRQAAIFAAALEQKEQI
jgi:hypothetical protein